MIGTKRLSVSIFSLWCALSLACTATIPVIHVRGELAGQRIDTTVDSKLAKYYVEQYLPGNRIKPEFDQTLNSIHERQGDMFPSRKFLRCLSNRGAVDFAALYLANQILKDEINEQFQSLFQKELSKIKSPERIERLALDPACSSYVMLFVPGWFYKSDPWTGADLARERTVASRLGLANLLIDTEENGTIEENADIIAEEIVRVTELNKRIVLVSVSKAGPEVAQALGEVMDHHETRNVKAWINIGGLLQGSLIADSALRWPKRWLAKLYFTYKGWDFDSVASMGTERSRSRLKRLSIPQRILIINYIAIPLSGDVSVLARDRYMDLRNEGPNDGLTLITDAIAPNSITVAQLGVDHFFLDPDIDAKAAALIRTVINELESGR